ncbi:MAG: pyridoxal phosphate-dependent aminotransferase, partial [Xanthobacteraceae bacterium]
MLEKAKDPLLRNLIQPSGRSGVPPFMVMDVMAAAARLEAHGRRIIHMEVGQPAVGAP